MENNIEINGLWENMKTKNKYWVIGTAINCTNKEDGQLMVLYGSSICDIKIFAREKKEFEEKFVKVML